MDDEELEGWFIVWETGPGYTPVVRVWTAKTGWFGSKPVQQPDPPTVGGPNPDPYPSTCESCQVWLDPSVPIYGSVFRDSHSWSHSDMLLLIVKCWPWYITGCFRRIGWLNEQNEQTLAPYYFPKMILNRVPTIFGLASSVTWVALHHKDSYTSMLQPLLADRYGIFLPHPPG